MQSALELVNGLSDSQVVEVTKELFKTLYTNLPYKQVKQNWESVADVAPLAALETENLKKDLSAADSARLSRLLLERFACDSDLSALVLQSWETVRNSDNLIVDVIISIGLIVNLTLMIATTKVKLQKSANGGFEWSISKAHASKELIAAIVEPLAKIVNPKL
jgi:hypothetical protein